jgi:catechol 2,3-dioxygenase
MTEQVGISAPGHRLPAELRLGGVRLQVADLQRSLDWYQRVLGLRVIDTTPDHARLAARQDTAATPETLVVLVEHKGAAPVPPRGRIGLYHFAVLLPDRTDVGRFIAHLAQHHIEFGAADHRVSEAIYLQDPDGLGIEVYSDRPRSTWQIDGRQIVMTTDPLDLHDLVTAAGADGSVPWAGLPAGTRIGHVHLHVGDLQRAADFYYAALGLDKTVWNYPGALFLSAGGYHHHLGVNTWAANSPVAGPADARLLEWEMRLPDSGSADAVVASLDAAGYDVTNDANGAVVRDPWGTQLRLTV